MTMNELKEAYEARKQAQLARDAKSFAAKEVVKGDEFRVAVAILKGYKGITELGIPQVHVARGVLSF